MNRNNKFVYLAGPITGLRMNEANDWRDYVKSKLHTNIIGISPLRGEPPIEGVYAPHDKDSKFRHPKAIAAKNYYDTHNCDAILAYIPLKHNSEKPSFGTVFELGWATGINIPTILVTDDPRLVEHPIIEAKVNWVLPTLDDAIEIVHGLFDAYVGNGK
jgi:nucleoside 2-deoxyribosyltransferase